MKQNLQSYHELIASLEERFNDVNHLHGQRDSLKAEAEEHKSQREKVLADAVFDTSEEAIDNLAKHNARQEVFAAKIKHIEGQAEQVEDELQHSLNFIFLPPFKNLFGSLLHHRFERGKAQIAKLVAAERSNAVAGLVEQLARHTESYAECQKLEIYVSDGVASPLHDTPGVKWSQYRQDTFRIVLNATQSAIEGGKRLLAVVETERSFSPPEIPSQDPAPAAVEVNEPELVEA